jgi:hypothetical protein
MTSSRYDTDTKSDKSAKIGAKTLPPMPAGGTIVSAAGDYSLLTATKPAGGVLAFQPGLPVVAWSIGADGAAYPVTSIPPSPDALAAGTLQVDGRVLGADGTLYAGALEWQAAVKTADESAMIDTAAAEAEAKAKVDAKADAKANAKAETKAETKAT